MRSLYAVLVFLLILGGVQGTVGAAGLDQNATPVLDSASLNLTPEQKEKIQLLREERWAELKPLRIHLFTKFNELKSFLSRSNPDESRIDGMKSEILSIQAKIHEKLTAYRMQLRRILTKEQRNNLTAYGLERGYFRTDVKPAGFNEKKMGDARRP
jgi:hypothetical protein